MPTVYIQMSKRCAIAYPACESCAEKQQKAGHFIVRQDDYTLEAVKRLKQAIRWPPTCAFCHGPIDTVRIVVDVAEPAPDPPAIQEGLL